jgi:hypothetical protein
MTLKKLNEFLKIKEAAKLIGVTPNTLRNWESKGLIKKRRHPINNYRLYDIEELKKIIDFDSSIKLTEENENNYDSIKEFIEKFRPTLEKLSKG